MCLDLGLDRFDLCLLHVVCVSLSLCVLQLVACVLPCFDSLVSCVDRHCLFSFVVCILLCFDSLVSCVDRHCLFSFVVCILLCFDSLAVLC